jgi:hypothetical protein
MTASARIGLVALLALAGLLAGCENFDWGRSKVPTDEPAPAPRGAAASDVLVAGTVGEQAMMMSGTPQALRGFGIVVGLNGKGSSDCPSAVREYLVEYLTKQIAPQGSGERRAHTSPEKLIDSPDTAVVEVLGYVPAGAVAGMRFDLQVSALEGTSTQSLSGGLLLPTQLRIFDRDASGQGMFAGAVLGEAGGPVFVNPFAGQGAGSSDADPRRGTVLGGGRCFEARPGKLMLLQPNYGVARTMERRINERFGHEPKAASAQSKGYVTIETPPALAARPALFRRLVAHLYLDKEPTVVERRVRELVRLAAGGEVDLERAALIWEGVGKSVVPHIQPLYTHANPAVRYYAARCGLRLGDLTALPVVAGIANSDLHSLRLLAIMELGHSESPQAALKLVPLLSERDQEVRIAAYEALLLRGHAAIQSTRFPALLDPTQLNFTLDVVDTSGPPLIYVRRTRSPRIAVFGKQLTLMPPVFYTQPEDSLTVHTAADSEDVQLFVKRKGRLSDEITVPPRVVDVVAGLAHLPVRDEAGRLRGVGLPYARVVQVLADLCRSETLSVALVFEQTSMTELLGPEEVPERPETESDRSAPALKSTVESAPPAQAPAGEPAAPTPPTEPPPKPRPEPAEPGPRADS